MPLPSSINDLSTTPASNYPAGSESPNLIDDYLRTYAAYIATLRDSQVSLTGDQTVAGNKTFSSNPILSAGTANGVPYLNGSKVLTSGSALTFDGTTLNASTGSPVIRATASTTNALYGFEFNGGALDAFVKAQPNNSELRIASGRSAGWGGFTSFYIDTSEQMRLTSTGLGIGTSSPGAKLDVTAGSSVAQITSSTTSAGAIPKLRFFHTGNDAYSIVGGLYMAWLSSDTTERMRLDASGNLGLGVTPSAWGAGQKAFQMQGGSVWSYSTGNMAMVMNVYQDGTSEKYVNTGIPANKYTQNAGAHYWYNAPSGTAGNAISFTQAMTLDASGNLLVGTTSAGAGIGFSTKVAVDAGNAEGSLFKNSAGASAYAARVWNSATTGDNLFVWFGTEAGGTTRGSITYNRGGGLTAYNTTSDYRAKDIISETIESGSTIDGLKIYVGKMKGAAIERPMMIAHEAQAVVPYAVTGEKDAVNDDGTPKFQQMDHASLVPLLIAEIQSLRQRISALEAK